MSFHFADDGTEKKAEYTARHSSTSPNEKSSISINVESSSKIPALLPAHVCQHKWLDLNVILVGAWGKSYPQ